MSQLKRMRLAGGVLILSCAPLAVMAQTTQPAPQTSPPPAATPSPNTVPPTNTPPRSATAPSAKVNPLIGLAVFSSDGSKMGTVHSVQAEPDGKVKTIQFKTGGFLGFGAKLVSVPEGKFTRSGDNVQLGLTADDVSKLPEVKEQA